MRCSVVLPNLRCAFKCLISKNTNRTYTSHKTYMSHSLLIKISAARTRYRIALFIKIHSEIQSHAVQQVLDLGQ